LKSGVTRFIEPTALAFIPEIYQSNAVGEEKHQPRRSAYCFREERQMQKAVAIKQPFTVDEILYRQDNLIAPGFNPGWC
jgi:hypothetical protein